MQESWQLNILQSEARKHEGRGWKLSVKAGRKPVSQAVSQSLSSRVSEAGR